VDAYAGRSKDMDLFVSIVSNLQTGGSSEITLAAISSFPVTYNTIITYRVDRQSVLDC